MWPIYATKPSLPPDSTLDEELKLIDDDDVVEMVNLFPEDTGIDGVIFVSTEMASHGPRVKFSLKAGRYQPSFSVSIAQEPRILAQSRDISDHVVTAIGPRIIEWVSLNREALLDYWKNGTTWSRKQQNKFFDRLNKLPRD